MAERIFDTIGREMRYLEYKIKQHQAKRKRKKEKQKESLTSQLSKDAVPHHHRRSHSQDHNRTTLEITRHTNSDERRRRSSERSQRDARHSSDSDQNTDPWGKPSQDQSKQASKTIDHFDPWSSTKVPTQTFNQGLDLNEAMRGSTPTTFQFNRQPNTARLLPPPPKTVVSSSLSTPRTTSPVKFNNSWTQANTPPTTTTIFSSFPSTADTSSFDPFAQTVSTTPHEDFGEAFDQIAFHSQPESLMRALSDVNALDGAKENNHQTYKDEMDSHLDNNDGESFLGSNSALVNFNQLVSRTGGSSRELFHPKLNRVSMNEMKNDQQLLASTTPQDFTPNTQQIVTSPAIQHSRASSPGSNIHSQFASLNNPFYSQQVQQLSMSQFPRTSNNLDDLLR